MEAAGTVTGRPAGNGQDALRKALARWEFTRHAPARYWGSGALPDAEAAAYEAADELLALPELAAWVEQQVQERAAKELRAAADACPSPGHISLTGRRWLKDCADALVVNAPGGAPDR